MIMATAHSTVKARPGRNRPLKGRGTGPKPGKLAKTPAKRPSTQPAHAASVKPGSPEGAERGSHLRVRGRLQEMIRAELFNLEKAESVLRCLTFAMEFTDLTTQGVAYFPDVVEVAADLVQRSMVDLDQLYDGRIPDPLMAALKVER